MPPIEEQFREQAAVLWMANGTNDNYGKPQVIAPVAIEVRWDEDESEAIDSQGAKVLISATVVVDREIVVGSIMWLGDLEELPDVLTDLRRVASYSCVPDVKGREFHRSVKLTTFSDTLPEVVL